MVRWLSRLGPVFGLGNQYSVYWKLGASNEFTGSASGDSWHVYAGTLDASGQVNLLKDGVLCDPTIRSTRRKHQTRRLALGGSQANSNFLDF